MLQVCFYKHLLGLMQDARIDPRCAQVPTEPAAAAGEAAEHDATVPGPSTNCAVAATGAAPSADPGTATVPKVTKRGPVLQVLACRSAVHRLDFA